MRRRHLQVDFELSSARRAPAPRRPQTAAGCRRVSHWRRPNLDPSSPVHITLRVRDDVGRLRRRDAFKVLRGGMLERLGRDDLRIVHPSIQGNHIHMVCEASCTTALARGVQGFKISSAER